VHAIDPGVYASREIGIGAGVSGDVESRDATCGGIDDDDDDGCWFDSHQPELSACEQHGQTVKPPAVVVLYATMHDNFRLQQQAAHQGQNPRPKMGCRPKVHVPVLGCTVDSSLFPAGN
jgi:hypothetical protein